MDCDGNNHRTRQPLSAGDGTTLVRSSTPISTFGDNSSVVGCRGQLLWGPQGVSILGIEEMNLVRVENHIELLT